MIGLVAALAGHIHTERDAVRTTPGFLLFIVIAVFAFRWLRTGIFYVRAVAKRLSARRRIYRYVESHHMRFTEQGSPLLPLFRCNMTPEWVVDTDHSRYIISLFPPSSPTGSRACSASDFLHQLSMET